MMDFTLILFTAALGLIVAIALYIYATRTASHNDQVSHLALISCCMVTRPSYQRIVRKRRSIFVASYIKLFSQPTTSTMNARVRIASWQLSR